MTGKCPLCTNDLTQKSLTDSSDSYKVFHCSVCGKYKILDTLFSDLDTYTDDNKALLSHYITKAQSPKINREIFQHILDDGFPSISEQIENLILWVGNNTDPGDRVKLIANNHQYVTGAKSKNGFEFVVNYLLDQKYFHNPLVDKGSIQSGYTVKLTYDGWDRYNKILNGKGNSTKVFMAMEYSDLDLDNIVSKHFKLAAKQAGFDLKRLDENFRAGLIDDKMRVELQTSRFVIADLTHSNEGAYWEAGFAEGMGKVVIYTCKSGVKPHFDVDHSYRIIWDVSKPQEAAEKLKAAIRATFPHLAKMED